MSVEKNIIVFRQKLGLSQTALASELKVTQGLVSQWESGLKMPSINMGFKLIKLAAKKGLDISLEDIFIDHKQSKLKD